MITSLTRSSASALALVAALATVSACAATAADAKPVAATTSAQRTAVKTYLIGCLNERSVKPTSVTLACADDNENLDKLVWSTWGEPQATAVGTWVANTCTPYCAAGKLVRYPVTVRASHLKRHEYRQLSITFTGTVPSGHHRTEVVFTAK
ncbi:hypothetical protein [Nocardioides sp.]|uniref:hypothetical protein n=1 Tax=Nocardioides sp. TaxID=35761 RepID=UPI00260EC91D|nr:hypothetical protein [Nocardioides sp.]